MSEQLNLGELPDNNKIRITKEGLPCFDEFYAWYSKKYPTASNTDIVIAHQELSDYVKRFNLSNSVDLNL